MKRISTVLLVISILLLTGSSGGYFVPRPLEALVQERDAQSASPSSVLLLPELSALWDYEDPEAVLAAVAAAATDLRTPAWVRGYARWVQANLLLRLGRVDEARALIDELGFIQRWMVIGPFDNDNEAGFDRVFPVEEAIGGALDLEASQAGKHRDVSWREYPDPASPDGVVTLSSLMEPAESACALLATVVESSRSQRAALRFGADGALRAWLNGQEVYASDSDRRSVPDRDAVGVQLQRGRNRLVVKSCMVQGSWELFLRLTQPDGQPLSGVTVTTDAQALSAPPPRGSAPFEVPSLWAHFWEQVGGEPGEAEGEEGAEAGPEAAPVPARAWAELAQFLTLFGGDDPSEHRARDAAEAAIHGEITVRHLRLLARLHPDRNVRVDALRRALALEPRNLQVLMALAGEVSAGPHPEDAARLFDRAEQLDPGNLHVALARADLLDGFGLTQTALGMTRPLLEGHPVGRVRNALRSLANEAGNAELEEEMARRYFETHQSEGSLRVELARLDADRGEAAPAEALIRAGLVQAPLSTALRHELAQILESTGRVEEALALYRETLALRPDDGRLHEELAHFLDRQGQADEALAAARRSLALRPENPTLRQWISVVNREERFEEPYLEEPETFLARRGQGGGHDLRTLLDLEVRKVHRSGQSDEFRQLVFEAVTLQGARNLTRYQIAYTPHRQRLTVERARVHRPDGSTREAVDRSTRDLYDPSIRMYYDLRATTIAFGDLQAGDVVEIRYRLSDVGDANELGNYFGEVTQLQTSHPRARVAYVLLAPSDRELIFNQPRMEGLTHGVRQLPEGVVEHLFEARDVSPVVVETGMPPLAEVAPVLRVSTFRSWQELARWYWSLVRDQLELDAGQRARATELVAGLRTDLEKVRAIHRHVVQSVRYVALEFGVHRFKPYRVADIERRGFGDCKDQASLMIAMLEHVGVDAEIVLLRTRHLGRVEQDPPSLEIFNHAIVYVPSLQLYIDPTAERVAVGDLPSGDQGVMALRVGEEEESLGTIPMIDAERQMRILRLTLRLGAEGEATGRLRLETTGWLSGMSRAALDDQANQVSYLERTLSRYMRGVRVSNVTTSDLTELDSDTEAQMDVQVPGFARRDGEGLSFAVSVAPPLTAVVSLPRREQDLVFGPPTGWVEELDLELPPGTRVGSLPAPVEIDTPMVSFRMSVGQTPGGVIQVRSRLLWRSERVTPEQYGGLRDLIEQLTAARTARVRVVTP